jgi:predicted  nucleic acid-binding Zn-ribbon protein
MALTKEDLRAIKGIVVDVVDKKIDDLGGSIQKEFAFMRSEFDFMHKEFDNVHQEINSFRHDVDNKFASVRADIARISFEIDQLKSDLRKERKRTVEDVDLSLKKIANMEKDIRLLKSELTKLKAA